MSKLNAHPQRETKIRKWIERLGPDDEFSARDIARDLNLMPVEVGNILKTCDVMIVGKRYKCGSVWKRCES
jgi:hypothetical protein